MANPPHDQVSNEELLSMFRCFEFFVRRITQHKTIHELKTETCEVGNFVRIESGSIGFMIKHIHSETYTGIVMGKGMCHEGFINKWSVFRSSKNGDMMNEYLRNDPKIYFTKDLFEAEEIALIGMWESIGSYSQIDEFRLFGHWCQFGNCYYCKETNVPPRRT
jgi:hypothetical protein